MEKREAHQVKRAYVAPELIETDIEQTAFGGIPDEVENGFYYHS
jgi:hypothetical protein